MIKMITRFPFNTQANHEAAREYQIRALSYARELSSNPMLIKVFNSLSKTYLELDSLGLALAYTDSAEMTANNSDVLIAKSEFYDTKSQILERKGDFQEALHAFRTHILIKDSLYATNSKTVLSKLQQEYKTKEQKQRIELLEQVQHFQRL